MQLPGRKKRVIIYVLGFIVIGFLLLTAFVFFFPLSSLDREFSEEVQEHQNRVLDTVMKMVSWFGDMPHSVILVVGTALIFFIFKYKREAVFLVLTMISGVISTIIKLLVDRPRPLSSLVRIVEKTQQQSFPSGHVLFYISFFGFLTFLMYHLNPVPKIIRLFVSTSSMLLIFTVPLSRIYLGAHWFTDVLGGFLIGLLCLYTLGYFFLKNSIKQ